MACKHTYKGKRYTETEIKDLILEQDVLKNNPIITFTKKIFKTLPYQYKEDLLNEGSRKYGIERGESKATVKYSQADQNKVDFGLKSIEILQSDKAIQTFVKGEKNNWDLNRILTELQIPKEQKELILDRGFKVLTNSDARLANEPNLREQIITDLLSNYSYTIEINTAKTKDYSKATGNDQDIYDIMESAARGEVQPKVEDRPTQYYSNLTVAGGTNYTENEIATPAITPSIKGHAQFATPNGIGWFRADESQQYQETDIQSIIDNLQKSGQLEINCK